jgi:glycosyltransferase involved in cell wall biosynthesis
MRRKELEKGSSLLLAASKFVRDHLIRQEFPPNKVKVHYIGVDTGLFCPDSNIVRDPMVLFVGRLEEVKGCEYLIRAMTRVRTAFPAARLLIIGDGSLRRSLERRAEDSRVNATFLGFQPPAEVKRWMNRASILAAPSVRTSSGSEEGCGLALLEAQAMGLPVVSFISGGIPEIVCHGETGFLSSERDHQSLSQHILMLLSDKKIADRVARAARARVKRLFDLQTQTRALEAIYQDVIWPRTSCPSIRDPAKEGSSQERGSAFEALTDNSGL